MSNPEILEFLSEIDLDAKILSELQDDLENSEPCSASELNQRIRERFGVDLSGSYAGISLEHPFGKAAGQLSMTPGHVSSDRKNGLSFTVLKSAVGVTEGGEIGIGDWEKAAPKMVLEKRTAMDGRDGWTVTWKGRGWIKGFDAYVDFYRDSLEQNPGYPAIPSLMVDITDPARADEQASYCIGRLIDVHKAISSDQEFLIEMDVSPTTTLLPGSETADVFAEWMRNSTASFNNALAGYGKFIVKIPNTGRGVDFQMSLVRSSIEKGSDKLAGLLIGNRLFDKEAVFEGQIGIAYGGWDLSNANLETLDRMIAEGIKIPLIGTGNICSGKMMAEYAIRGCLSGEMHTFFQLPPTAYRAPKGSGGRTSRALRELIYHPDDGLVAVLLRLEKSGKIIRSQDILRFTDLPEIYSVVKGLY